MLRAYVATSSNVEDRTKAISIGTAAYALGLTAGPGLQAAFTPIGYPGFVTGQFHLDMYTVPGFSCVIASAICLLLLITIFRESYAGVDNDHNEHSKCAIIF